MKSQIKVCRKRTNTYPKFRLKQMVFAVRDLKVRGKIAAKRGTSGVVMLLYPRQPLYVGVSWGRSDSHEVTKTHRKHLEAAA